MIAGRLAFLTSLLATAVACFTLGIMHARSSDLLAARVYDAKIDAIRAEVRSELGRGRRTDAVVPAGTTGQLAREDHAPNLSARERMVREIKQELQSEMGLLPVHLLRDRRSSFVELYSTDNFGKTNYGTAGYLGHGYFVTVKHAVVALKDEDNRQSTRKITSVRIVYRGKEIPAKVIDTGDADVEVHTGDWAIIKTRDVDLPPLHVDASFAFDFADPIFRLGNDYSKGIILSTGYVGQRTANGLVTCLTDGHPRVPGGGIPDHQRDLPRLPIGRMQGAYRFSFLLPTRRQMLRHAPAHDSPAPPHAP